MQYICKITLGFFLHYGKHRLFNIFDFHICTRIDGQQVIIMRHDKYNDVIDSIMFFCMYAHIFHTKVISVKKMDEKDVNYFLPSLFSFHVQ